MEIKYINTFWGQEHLPAEEFLAKAKKAGYDGVEMNVAMDPAYTKALSESLERHEAILVAQQWLPPLKETVEQYRQRMKIYLEHLASLNPVFINSHTGKDYYSFQDNCSLIETCMEISERTGVKIIHETHRGRFSFHVASLLPYLEKYPTLELNADLSHFSKVFHICPEFGPAPYMPTQPFTQMPVADQWQINVDMRIDESWKKVFPRRIDHLRSRR